ncbi:GntR family transcriptional regulator (plasmid) [Mycobacterium dioxanotrophicus]|uniref:GntR family transcriptional regulator n=1 Tax=Mycobacterium dioxanotrophicus TaxID=482462 RepID=A0A1Y0CG67_9MYCO|nr:GntR family transcriptional regulator [Mycobacterium dioxanotrophicus]
MQDDSEFGVTGWTKVKRARVHELVIDQIEERIRHGGLQRGDRLPSERQLSQLLGVSRPSVREALHSLEALGVIAERVTSGPESAKVLATEPSDALTSMLRLHIGLSNFSEVEVVQTRLIVEEWAVREAASTATDTDIENLGSTLDAMEVKPEVDILRFNALDTVFHTGLAQASGNRLIAYLTGALRDTVERHRLAAMRALGPWPSVSASLQMEHRRILDAIIARDADAAAVALRDHLRHTYPGSSEQSNH